MPPTYTPAELAAALNRSEEAFRRRWRRLATDHGFPRPLPGCGLVWSRVLVDAWIAGNGCAILPEPEEAERPLTTIERQRLALEQRYGAAA